MYIEWIIFGPILLILIPMWIYCIFRLAAAGWFKSKLEFIKTLTIGGRHGTKKKKDI